MLQNSRLCTLASATSQFWWFISIEKYLVLFASITGAFQRRRRSLRKSAQSRSSKAASTTKSSFWTDFDRRPARRGKEQLTCSTASVVRKLPNLQLCDFGSWSTSGKNSSWERSWNRSEAKLDKIYWSVNREKSVRGKMQRGVANLLGPILGVSKELF